MPLSLKTLTLTFAIWLVSQNNFSTLACFRPNCTGRAFDRDETSNLAETAFKLCDVEEPVGLTWTEVEDCEETFCAVLSFQCPTHSDFQGFDQNQDGVLTWQEYQEVYDSLGN